MHRLRTCFFVLFVIFSATSCSSELVEVVREIDEKQYQLAKGYQAQGREDEALSAFLRVIDARRDSPESHFEAGYIYLQKMKDPISAIYHFKCYILLKGINMLDLVDGLKKENEILKRESVAAKKKVKQLESILGSAGRISTDMSVNMEPLVSGQQVSSVDRSSALGADLQIDPTAVPRAYTVQSGDSLSSISRQLYGTTSRWNDIFQANRDRISSENALRVGQELRIP